MFNYVAIACILGVAAAAPSGSWGPIGVGVDSVSVPRYNFNYAVNDPLTGDNKAQNEVREGGVVKGSYSLSEPDGTIRVVEYAADPVTGFNAVVKRLGPAVHPQQILAPVISKQIVPIAAAPISLGNIGYGQAGLGLGNIGLGNIGLGNIGLGNIGLGNIGLINSGLGLGNIGLSGLGLGLDGLGLSGNLGSWKH